MIANRNCVRKGLGLIWPFLEITPLKWRFNNDRFLNRGRKVNIEGKDKKESTQFPCGFADYGFAAIISKWLANFD